MIENKGPHDPNLTLIINTEKDSCNVHWKLKENHMMPQILNYPFSGINLTDVVR